MTTKSPTKTKSIKNNIMDITDSELIKKTKTVRRKHSFMGEAVANDLIDKVRKGQKINMQEIQKAHGYSETSALAMRATQTQAYKEAINPVLERMTSLRDKVLNALHRKDLDEQKVFDLNLLLKNLNHDTQLLGGKATQNHAHVNKIVVYGSDDFLSLQMTDDKQRLN